MKNLIVVAMMMVMAATSSFAKDYEIDYLDDGTEIAIFADGSWKPTKDLVVEVREEEKEQDNEIIEWGSNKIKIERISLSSSGNWTDVQVQTGKRGVLHCTAFDKSGRALKSVDWMIEHRHTTLHIQVATTNTVKCDWN